MLDAIRCCALHLGARSPLTESSVPLFVASEDIAVFEESRPVVFDNLHCYLPDCVLMIRFKVNIFGKNTTWVIVCISTCIMLGDKQFQVSHCLGGIGRIYFIKALSPFIIGR